MIQTAQSARQRHFVAPPENRNYEIAKRAFDAAVAACSLVVLSPVLLMVALAVWLQDGASPLFCQERLTKGGKTFKMYKFRSMCVDAEQQLEKLLKKNQMEGPAFKLDQDPRVTKLGRLLRKTSIDELPQLWNVLKGDMSIIGPRPPLPREVAQYDAYQLHRLDVKTGLACYHECQGRSREKSFDKWVESDLQYIRERSMRTDLRILFLTARAVLTGKGAM